MLTTLLPNDSYLLAYIQFKVIQMGKLSYKSIYEEIATKWLNHLEDRYVGENTGCPW
jgi:hypothetical protein